MAETYVRRSARVWRFASSAKAAMALAFTLALLSTACNAAETQATSLEIQTACTACHGRDGRSVSVRAPILASQPQPYLVAQLNAFRDRSRADPHARAFMWPMAAGLTDPVIEGLASYFAALPPVRGDPDPAAGPAVGEAIYEKGAVQRGIVPCGSCHGDKAQGLAVFPRLAGQHADYLNEQLLRFADGSRDSPIMGPVAKNLSAEEMRSLSGYLSSK